MVVTFLTQLRYPTRPVDASDSEPYPTVNYRPICFFSYCGANRTMKLCAHYILTCKTSRGCNTCKVSYISVWRLRQPIYWWSLSGRSVTQNVDVYSVATYISYV